MNRLIEIIAENNLSKEFYDAFFALGFVSVFLFIFFFGKKMKIKAWKPAAVVLLVYPTAVLLMFVLYWLEVGFFGGNNIVRVFVYIPLIAYPVAKLLKLTFKEIMSLLSIGPIAVHGVSHFGCVFVGCCNGHIQNWGIYNPQTGARHFPIQPIEAIIALLIIFYLLARAKKRNYIPDGREYPLMLTIFGSTRFICEFLRDNDKLFFGISSLALHALFMFVVGVIWLVVLNKKEAKETSEIMEQPEGES